MWHYSDAAWALSDSDRQALWVSRFTYLICDLDFTPFANPPLSPWLVRTWRLQCISQSWRPGGSAAPPVFPKNSPLRTSLGAQLRSREMSQMKRLGKLRFFFLFFFLWRVRAEVSLKPLNFRTGRPFREVSQTFNVLTDPLRVLFKYRSDSSGGAWDFAFLIRFWMMLLLWVGGPHF